MPYQVSDLADITVPQKWDSKLLKARYATSAIMPVVLNKTDMAKDHTDTITIPIEPSFTAAVVTNATGAFTPSVTVPTSVTITVNRWVYVATEITTMAQRQSFWDPNSALIDSFGKAMGVDYDLQLGLLYSSVLAANNIGIESNPEAFSSTDATAGMLLLADLNVPLKDLTFALPPTALYSGWYKSEVLTAAHSGGYTKNLLVSGDMPPILGVPVRTTTSIASVTNAGVVSRKGLLFHKEAFAIAMQLNNTYKTADRTGSLLLSEVGVMASLFGTAVPRSNHAVVFNIRG